MKLTGKSYEIYTFRVLFLLLILLCICYQCKAGDPCPNATELAPCTCSQRRVVVEGAQHQQTPKRGRRKTRHGRSIPDITKVDWITTVRCKSPKSLQELEERVSRTLYRKWVDKLILSDIPARRGYNLAMLPGSIWLEKLRIRYLEISDTQLSEDFLSKEYSLKHQRDSLVWLKVSNCFLSGALDYSVIGTIQTHGLHHLRRLQRLDFSSNRLTVVRTAAFTSSSNFLPNLKVLALSHNEILSVESGAFPNTAKLQHLDLSHNQLTSISPSIFQPRDVALQHLDLSWNSLTELSSSFFTGLSALKSVNMSHNFLYSLPENPWKKVWKQLNYVDVAGNFIECTCEITWLLSSELTNGSHPIVTGRCLQSPPVQILDGVSHDLSTLTLDKICPVS